jgi:hypothetical protein
MSSEQQLGWFGQPERGGGGGRDFRKTFEKLIKFISLKKKKKFYLQTQIKLWMNLIVFQ